MQFFITNFRLLNLLVLCFILDSKLSFFENSTKVSKKSLKTFSKKSPQNHSKNVQKSTKKISYLRLRRDTRWNIRQNMATALVHYRFLNIIHSINQDSKQAFGDQAFQSLQTALEIWFKPVDSSFHSGLYQTTQIYQGQLKAFSFNITTFEVT